MFLYPANPQSRRHCNLVEYSRTNFSLGQTPRMKASTYKQDYTKGVFLPHYNVPPPPPQQAGPLPSVQSSVSQPLHAASEHLDLRSDSLQLKPPATAPVVKKRVRFEDEAAGRPLSQDVRRAAVAPPVVNLNINTDSSSQLPDIHGDSQEKVPSYSSPTDAMRDRRKQLQCTHFEFGNDPPERLTTYKQFNSSLSYPQRQRPCTPPNTAQILPNHQQNNIGSISTLDRDFTFFGDSTQRHIYSQRVADVNNIKLLHETDSVAASLLGKRRKMLTRAMIDYQHPVERLRTGRIKQLMVHQISPSVRQDSVWKSVGIGGKLEKGTETKANYSWPLANNKGMTIIYRGYMNNAR